MNNTRKYLKITVHDSDFAYPMSKAVAVLYDICYANDKYPDEDDLENVRHYINQLCFIIKQADDHYGCCNTPDKNLSNYLIPDVCIVDESDIPGWNNFEDFFMPLYDTDKNFIIR